jgi:membrane protease YdiL (CAAX protease family)
VNQRPISTHAKPWLFLALTLGLTWFFGFLGVALQSVVPRTVVLVLVYGGGLAPLLVALWLTYRQHSPAFRKDYWQRALDVRRIGLMWWGVILLFHPLKSLLAALIDVLTGGWGIVPEAAARFVEQPLLILPTLVFWLLFGPIPEELGWRGYALDGLQARHGAAVSGLMIGMVWALWHLPLFFVEGTWQATHLGFGTQLFWVWVFSVMIESILYVWIYNNTGRSTLSAILFHFGGNAFGQLFALSHWAETTTLLISVVTTVIVMAHWGPKNLQRT